MDIVDKINEATADKDGEAEKLAADIGKAIKKHFKKSFINSRVAKMLGKAIVVTFALGKDKSEWSNGIIDNDKAFHKFMIHLSDSSGSYLGDDGSLPDKLTIEMLQGGSIYGPNFTGSAKVGWRKKTGSPEAIVKHMDKYFEKLRKTIKDKGEELSLSLENK